MMAIKNCMECYKEVSDTASACPHCGAKPPKKTSILTWAAALFFVAIIGSCISSTKDYRDAAASKPQPSPEQLAEKKKGDDEINTAVLVLRGIKKGVKNPKSFDLDSFIIFPGGSTCYEYHATNSFNALVPGSAVLDAKKSRVWTSDGDGNKFVKVWNEICTKPGGSRDHAGGLKLLNSF